MRWYHWALCLNSNVRELNMPLLWQVAYMYLHFVVSQWSFVPLRCMILAHTLPKTGLHLFQLFEDLHLFLEKKIDVFAWFILEWSEFHPRTWDSKTMYVFSDGLSTSKRTWTSNNPPWDLRLKQCMVMPVICTVLDISHLLQQFFVTTCFTYHLKRTSRLTCPKQYLWHCHIHVCNADHTRPKDGHCLLMATMNYTQITYSLYRKTTLSADVQDDSYLLKCIKWKMLKKLQRL